MTPSIHAVALTAFALVSVACSSDSATQGALSEQSASAIPVAEPPRLVVYSGRAESLVGTLLQRFERETGILIEPRYGETTALSTQLLSEARQSPADVIFAQDSGYLGALSKANLLDPLPPTLLNSVDPRFRDPNGCWIGTSGRARVLVYSTALVKPEELPDKLEDLADPKWKGKIGWAPANSSLRAHLSYLRHRWGDERTRDWMQRLLANEPKAFPKNSPQITAVIAGEIHIGWVNHYYLHRQRGDVPARNYSFAIDGDPGNVLMVSGLGIRKGSVRRTEALKLIAFLLSEAGQSHFANHNFEYPTVPGAPTHPSVPPVAELRLAEVDQIHLADLGPTLTMLRQLGLR